MFEFSRDLRRVLSGSSPSVLKDTAPGNDLAMLELLPVSLLRQQAQTCEADGRRANVEMAPLKKLEASLMLQELARRTGEKAVLSRARRLAAGAAEQFELAGRQGGLARARVEEAKCLALEDELFGGNTQRNAAKALLSGVQRGAGAAGPLARATLVKLKARRGLSSADRDEIIVLAQAFDEPLTALQSDNRRRTALRLFILQTRLDRCEVIAAGGIRLRDAGLIENGLMDLRDILAKLDPNYEPLSYLRAKLLEGDLLSRLGEVRGELSLVAEGVDAFAKALEAINRDHSPLDWAGTQTRLGVALSVLGDAMESDRPFDQSIACFDRAMRVLQAHPDLALHAVVAAGRAMALARTAEITGDLAVLDAAETAYRINLGKCRPNDDPLTWALTQLQLAQVYVARIEITGQDNGAGEKAAVALSASLDVFAEHGLRSMSLVATQALERLRCEARPGPSIKDAGASKWS